MVKRPATGSIPDAPGSYQFKDANGRIIYVGKAASLRSRLSNYFADPRTLHPRTAQMVATAESVEWTTVRNEVEALMLEYSLIKEHDPRFNVRLRDDKSYPFLAVTIDEKFPRAMVMRGRKRKGTRYFGPYAHAGALRQTLNFMRKKFGVLTFGRGSPTERELKSSTYQVPVRLSETTAEQYRERVAQACDFLEGHSREMIGTLEEEMKKAAEKLDFEKAAELRNMLEDLKRTTRPMRRFTRHSLPSAIDPVIDVQSLADALQLERLPVVMECFDISNISTTHVVASMVCFRNGVPDKDNYRRYRIRTVGGQDDFASMAEVVKRRYARVLLEARAADPGAADYSQENPLDTLARHSANESSTIFVRLPDLIIVDGGKGQLSSACHELQRLGLHDLAIIGLAKEYEEIYRPGRSLPLQLPVASGALRLLQRIRDEAHRFANTYHQLLMKKRIGESILDDCPGVSQNRKNLLLRRFGSVNRLRKASVEEIAATEGIGSKLAEDVHRFLQRH